MLLTQFIDPTCCKLPTFLNCKKQSARAKCKVTGWHGTAIDYWNKKASKITKAEMDKEVQDLILERKKEDPFNEYRVYDYYWHTEKGEVVYKKC